MIYVWLWIFNLIALCSVWLYSLRLGWTQLFDLWINFFIAFDFISSWNIQVYEVDQEDASIDYLHWNRREISLNFNEKYSKLNNEKFVTKLASSTMLEINKLTATVALTLIIQKLPSFIKWNLNKWKSTEMLTGTYNKKFEEQKRSNWWSIHWIIQVGQTGRPWSIISVTYLAAGFYFNLRYFIEFKYQSSQPSHHFVVL